MKVRLFFTSKDLAERDETVAEALIATEALVQAWRPPRGIIDHLRRHHGVRTHDVQLYLLGCFFKVVAKVEGLFPLLIPESQNDLLVYVSLLNGEGITPWKEPLPDLHAFLDDAAQAVMAKEMLACSTKLQSAMEILVRSGCGSLEDAEYIVRASERHWVPLLDGM